MVKKIVKALFNSILLIVCVSNCNSLEERQKNAIETVLREDKSLMVAAQNENKNKKNQIAVFTVYTQQMKMISLEHCPPDFSESFRKHIYAWEDAVKQMRKKDDDFLGSLFGGLIGFFTGNAPLALGSLAKILADNGVDMQQVTDTWREVELSAIRYKAKLPGNQD
ncbi:MAG TPA: hypothetical protein PK683_15955 [Leptospiraceae bacterium]|nr:hypothetical protein [Leptospiraceae bacterium]